MKETTSNYTDTDTNKKLRQLYSTNTLLVPNEWTKSVVYEYQLTYLCRVGDLTYT